MAKEKEQLRNDSSEKFVRVSKCVICGESLGLTEWVGSKCRKCRVKKRKV